MTVGIPVRHGGPLLERAVASVREQTHENLQILIGDNARDESVSARCSDFARSDPRVTILRSGTPISAVQNFARLFESAVGKYFAWAADDDLRDRNYVSTLLCALEEDPTASLAFSDLALIDAMGDLASAEPRVHDFGTAGMGLEERLRKQAFCSPYHVYGLIRATALRGYPWYEPDMAPDWPLIAWLATRGAFVYRPGTVFYYQQVDKSEAEKAHANALRPLRRFQGARVAWTCADAVLKAALPERPLGRLRLVCDYYLWHGRGWKHLVLSRSPAPLRRAWLWFRGARGGSD